MTKPKAFGHFVQIAVRLPSAMVAEADWIARELSTEAMPVTRSDALRMALRLGMQRMAAEGGVTLSGDPPDP